MDINKAFADDPSSDKHVGHPDVVVVRQVGGGFDVVSVQPSASAPELRKPLCLTSGCGKQTWNGMPNEYCSRSCKREAVEEKTEVDSKKKSEGEAAAKKAAEKKAAEEAAAKKAAEQAAAKKKAAAEAAAKKVADEAERVILEHLELRTWDEVKALKELYLHYCKELQTLPESIGQCQALANLNLLRCEKLQTQPDSIGQCKALEVLKLTGCE